MDAAQDVTLPVFAKPIVKAPPRRTPWHEPLTPFVAWAAEERAPLADGHLAPPGRTSLLIDLLREPRAVVERLLDPQQTLALVLGSVAMVLLGTGFFTAIASAARGSSHFLIQSQIAGANVLMAVAAALGPIYAASILACARVPMGRLVATLVSSAATGALVLAGLSPVVYVLWRLDPVWAGPLSLVGAFGVAGLAGGARIHQVLTTMAEAVVRAAAHDPDAVLAHDDAFRVGILARVSLMVLGCAIALAFCGFDAFN
jgi:hypothetical protein